ncbi:O-methyltransferase-domain-containing protein [Phaeosphaeriaceae sp. PMI808]|nr:O-methyltransferase-domain-containing protein [Phaeosphaeriaceae sp. PMI808]
MAPNHDEDVLHLIDQIVSERAYFTSNRESNETNNDADERKQRLNQLGESARKLISATQQPHLAFWDLIRRCSLLSPVKIAQELGVFRHLATHETATAKELAMLSGADESFVSRILRPLVAEGLVSEPGEESYSLTSRGTPFSIPSYEDQVTFAIEFLPIVLHNPAFFKENRFKEPISHEGFQTPLAAYFKKAGYGFFDYLRDNPSVQKNFVSSMKAQMQNTRLTSSVYPYAERLSSNSEGDACKVAIVDVGGSKGETLAEIKATYPSIQGRMIVQDRAPVFESMQSKPRDIEFMVHDIFTEQPIKGAGAYHLKRILHDWSDQESRTILKHLVDAMDKDRSRILIIDMVLPTRSPTFSQAMGDHSMLTFGGKERNEKEWRKLLSSVGLEIGNIYRGPEPEAVIECFQV